MIDRHDMEFAVRMPRRRRQRRPTGIRIDQVLSPDEWSEVVRALGLSPRQAQIVELLLHGRKDKDIAEAMGLTLATVRTYFSRIFDRVQVADRVELVLRVFATFREIERRDGCHQE